jgi:plastocyanin
MNRALVLLIALVAAIGLVACGGDDEDDGGSADTGAATTEGGGGGGGAGGGAQTLKVTADATGQLAWTPKTLQAKAGEVTIELDNPSPVPHNVEIEGNGVDEVSDTVSQDTTTVSAELKPGEYEYYCNVPGHKEAGMDGTLTVE